VDDAGVPGLEAPKGNASREEWANYADARGIEYEPEAGQREIRAAVAAHDEA
jgi:hypothetical protein